MHCVIWCMLQVVQETTCAKQLFLKYLYNIWSLWIAYIKGDISDISPQLCIDSYHLTIYELWYN